MMSRPRSAAALLLAGLLATGCDSATAPDDAALLAEDLVTVALQLETAAAAALDAGLASAGFAVFVAAPGASGTVPFETSITRTQGCPRGGSILFEATVRGEGDRATRSLTSEMRTVTTHRSCAHGRGADGGITVTLDGNPNLTQTTNRKIVNGQLSGPQTSTQKGGFTFRTSDGRSGSCEVDLTSVYDPATETMTLKGTSCGRAIDVTRRRGG